MFENIRKSISQAIYTAKNSISLPNAFLKMGSKKNMYADWGEVVMSDQDHYTGYSYAAISKRANSVARVAHEFIKTEAKIKDFDHPYLPLIRDSLTFSEYDFWNQISTYLDLEGVYYLMALRNFSEAEKRTGSIPYKQSGE